MKSDILSIIGQSHLINKGETVLAAFSGGADSTALLTALFMLQGELGFTLIAAHFNHGIRGLEADEDESFCRGFCEKRGIPFYSKKADVPAFSKENGLSTETAARLLRYEFLYEISKLAGAAAVAVAHHAEDNAESILMHVFRGSGIAGLCGMRKKSELTLPRLSADGAEKSLVLIRPLLDLKKSELLEFLSGQNQSFCTDKTNYEADSTRNFLRLRVMPLIESGINAGAVKNILRLGKIAAEDERCLSDLAKAALDEARTDGGYLVKKLVFLREPIKKRAIRLALFEHGALVDAETAHIEGICELLKKQSGASADLHGARARISFDKLIIEKTAESCEKGLKNSEKSAVSSVFPLKIEEGVQNTPLGAFRLSFIEPLSMENAEKKEYNRLITADRRVAFFDRDKLFGELCVRTRRNGDRFRPVNCEWRMKLKDFFISRRVDEKTRDAIPLLVCGGEIVFIPGFLIADGVKTDENTERILRVEYLG